MCAELLAQLSSAEGVSAEFRKKMAWKAYQHTASYDAQVCVCVFYDAVKGCAASVLKPYRAVLCGVQVAEWLWGQVGGGEPAPAMSVPMQLSQGLRCGWAIAGGYSSGF